MGLHSRFMYPAARINPKYHRQRLIRLSSLIQKLCTTVEGLQHPLGKYLASAYALNLMLYYRPKKGLDVMLAVHDVLLRCRIRDETFNLINVKSTFTLLVDFEK